MRNCTGAFSLPKGKIVVGGTIVFADLYDLAVLGGTGLLQQRAGNAHRHGAGRQATFVSAPLSAKLCDRAVRLATMTSASGRRLAGIC
jgi:hypothetical protein